jgi:hypothetical protein
MRYRLKIKVWWSKRGRGPGQFFDAEKGGLPIEKQRRKPSLPQDINYELSLNVYYYYFKDNFFNVLP